MLDLQDLYNALKDERHNGYGYATRRNLDPPMQVKLDNYVILRANQEGLNAEQLFIWTDSKYGRYLVDGISGLEKTGAVQERVAEYLNAAMVRKLEAEADYRPKETA